MRVVGLTRVSAESQAREGVSLEAQAHKIRLYAELHDLDLVGIEEDVGVSGKSLDRPGLRRVLAALASGEADGVVVAKLDRLTRSVADLDRLLTEFFGDRARRPVALFSVAENVDTRSASGRLAIHLLTVVSQWEREAIGERTRDALAHKRAQGEVYGPVPFGFEEVRGRLVEVREESEAVSGIRRLRAEGWGFRKIASHLAARGVPTKRGGKWAANTVRRIVRRLERDAA